MITLNIVEKVVKNKIVSEKKSLKVFTSLDNARKFIKPIATEMKMAKRQNRDPKIAIVGASYDNESEEKMLCELGAITLTKYESDF